MRAEMWAETAKYAQQQEGEHAVETETKTEEAEVRAQEKAVEDEVDKITREIEKSLQIGAVPKDDEPVAKADSEIKPESGAAAVDAPEATTASDGSAPVVPTDKVEVVEVSGTRDAGEEDSDSKEKKSAEGKL